MAGKKRVRKAAASSKGKSQAKSKADDVEEELESSLPSSQLFILLQELHRLAMDPDGCQKTLQALADGTSSVLNLVGNSTSASSTASAKSAAPAPDNNSTASPAAASSAGSTTAGGGKKKKRSRTSTTATASAPSSAAKNSNSVKDVDKGGYWILLATHVINRLLPLLRPEDEEKEDTVMKEHRDKVAQILSLVCYYLVRVLLPIQNDNNPTSSSAQHDKMIHKLLEKACTNRARSLLGRAVLSVTIASTGVLDQLVPPCDAEDEDENHLPDISMECWIPASLALDAVVRLSHACPKTFATTTTASSSGSGSSPSSPGSPGSSNASEPALSTRFWDFSQTLFEYKAMAILNKFSSDLETICDDLSKELQMTKWEEPHLVELLGHGSASQSSSPPPAKRANIPRKSSRGTSAPSANEPPAAQASAISAERLQETFQSLLKQSEDKKFAPNMALNAMKMDGRVAAKRWASMVLIWLMQGQKLVLQVVLNMLRRRHQWQVEVWDTNAMLEMEAKGGSKKNTKKKSELAAATLPENVALLALVSRLVVVVIESHSQSGSRAPSGGLEAYARAINTFSSATASGQSKKPSKKTQKMVFPDLTDLATTVLYQLLRAHEDCLGMNQHSTDSSFQKWLINDDEDVQTLDYEGGRLSYHPSMGRLVEGLCRAAAVVSGTGATSYAEQARSVNCLQKIAASFVLQNLCVSGTTTTVVGGASALDESTPSSPRPLDVKLVQYALSQMNECLEKGEQSSTATNAASSSASKAGANVIYHQDAVTAQYALMEPIPPPMERGTIGSTEKRGSSRGSKATDQASSSTACTFGGIFSGDCGGNEIGEDRLFSLFLRAVVTPKKETQTNVASAGSKKKQARRGKYKKDDSTIAPTPSNFYSTILSVLECCYGCHQISEHALSERGGREGKRRGGAVAKEGKRKRRKMNDGRASREVESSEQSSKVYNNWLKFNAPCALLAETANEILTKCISSQKDVKSNQSRFHLLRTFVRDGIKTEHIARIISFTQTLDGRIVFPRTAHSLETKLRKSPSGVDSETAARVAIMDAPSFASFEKSLWMSQLNLCIAIGRDDDPAEGESENTYSSERLLQDPRTRLSVFKLIAATNADDDEWPLWLPSALRALVTFELTNRSPVLTGEDAERFVVDGFIESLKKTLQNLESFPTQNGSMASDRVVVDYEIPLSLQDARLLLATFGRLNATDRTKRLAKVVSVLKTFLANVLDDEDAQHLVTSNAEISGFVARVVTVCSHLAILVAVPELNERLLTYVRANQVLELPGFTSECDWYKSERCFMGIFLDWETARIPNVASNDLYPLGKSVNNDLLAILEKCFAIGFKAAHYDRGHLLFAAWNSMGNSPLWDSSRSVDKIRINQVEALLSAMENQEMWEDGDFARIITEIREGICQLYVDMKTHEGKAETLPMALKLSQDKDKTTATPVSIKKNLKSITTTGEKLLSALLDCKTTSPALFSCLEAAIVFITFGICSSTKPGDDAFSAAKLAPSKHPRGDSSESEHDQSDIESVDTDSDEDDPTAKLRERLRVVCTDFGGAPTHPDWLDSGCQLQFGIGSNEALDTARRAIKSLSRLLSVAMERHQKSLQKAIDLSHDTDEINDEQKDQVARKLLVLLTRYESIAGNSRSCLNHDGDDDDRRKRELLTSTCRLDSESVDFLTLRRAYENLEEAKTAWCPNSAQRIPGRYQEAENETEGGWLSGTADLSCSPPELRVDRQWEVFLGTALASSCRDIKCSSSKSSEQGSKKVSEALLDAENWFGVCETAVSCLMPAAALLRFGLSKGGRNAHLYASEDEEEHDTEELESFAQFQITERLPVSVSASKQLRESISETLGLLARYSAQCSGDTPSSVTCHAVAANLLVDARSFEDIRGFESSRFALTILSELQETGDVSPALSICYERLVAIVHFWAGRNEEDELTCSRLAALSLGGNVVKVDTIAEEELAVNTLLSLLDSKRRNSDISSPQERDWRWGSVQEKAILAMVKLFTNGKNVSNFRTRGCFAMMLSNLALAEYTDQTVNGSQQACVTKELSTMIESIDEAQLKGLISDIVSSSDDFFKVKACSALAYLVYAAPGQSPICSRVGQILSSLLTSWPQWLPLDSHPRDDILDIVMLFACYDNKLGAVGSILLQDVASDTAEIKALEELEPINKFFRFTSRLKQALLGSKGKGKGSSIAATAGNQEKKKSARNKAGGQAQNDQARKISLEVTHPPQSCTYATKTGFHGQHWYSCYSCGLTWDKGCCTLCALVCHEGHDVSYSRYSSFFCDCGAEDGGENDQSRVSCKCLSTVPKERVAQLFEKEGWPVSKTTEQEARKNEGKEIFQKQTLSPNESFYLDIAEISFPKSALASLEALAAHAASSNYIDRLFMLLRAKFDLWAASNSEMSLEEALVEEYDPVECHRYEYLRQSLQQRIGKLLEVKPLKDNCIIPLRAAKSGSFQTKFSPSTASERLKRSKNELSRAAIVASSRGILVIAEPASLLFCSAVPSLNLRNVHDKADIPLSRSSMCILGSSTIKFSVVGMELCVENERNLLVWGASEACVGMLAEDHSKVYRQITLALDFEADCESDYVVKCCWVPGSQTCVAVGCGRFLYIFDVTRADKDNRALPVISFGIGSETTKLKDTAIVPTHSLNQSMHLQPNSVLLSRNETVAIMFMLLENGRLLSIGLEYDRDGKLSARGEQQFDSSDSIAIPIAGVRTYQSAAVGMAGSQSHSLGEGSCLAFLSQSRVLVYKCATSCVVALTLGIKGQVNGSFELLPHTLTPEMLGTGATGNTIVGPFSNWTELGQTQKDDGSRFFRVACVGRSFRSNQPKLLCVEFNESEVRVREVQWESESLGLGLSLYSSFEGMCAFSLPYRVDDAAVPDARDGSRFSERGFLCAVTSNGCLMLYGEDAGLSLTTANSNIPNEELNIHTSAFDRPKSKEGTGSLVPDRSVLNTFPITIYERLKNLSEDSDCTSSVIYGGEGFGSDSKDIKRKLSRDNSVYLTSPRREGCTLTISLGTAERTPSDSGNRTPLSQELAFVAVRFLVGSTSAECIPKKIFVQGRPIEIAAGTKKWYSISLTDEEVALSVRAGVLAIGVSQASDSTVSPVLDALEIFAVEKNQIYAWLPKMLLQDESNLSSDNDSEGEDDETSKAIVVASRSLESLCDLLGPAKSLPKSESDLLKRMVQHTAMNRDQVVRGCVDNLLRRLYPSAQARNLIRDEGLLQGCSLLLSRCQILLENSKAMEDGDSEASFLNFDNAWFTVRGLLRSCLSTSAHIARRRPISYLRAADVIAENKTSSGSIAVDSSKLISEAIKRSLRCEDLCELFVELSLAERAIADNVDQADLASFVVVRNLLESSNLAVVERACHAISAFCRVGNEPQDCTNDLFAALNSARIVCYQCDSCGKVPITGCRYTLDEDEHDCDFDLCQLCHRKGLEFAKSDKNKDSAKTKVTIDGTVLDLTCELMLVMKRVSVVKADVTDVSDVHQNDDNEAQFDDAMGEEEQLQRALRMSMDKGAENDSVAKVDQSLEAFVEKIFNSVLELFSNSLSGQRSEPSSCLILSLLVDLVNASSVQGGKMSRAKKLVTEVSRATSKVISSASKSRKDFQRNGRLTLIMCLRSLAYLLAPELESDERELTATTQKSQEANVESAMERSSEAKQVLCDVHGIPAVRRRCARGEHKDRRFWVCGKDRALRCKFFRWADETTQGKSLGKSKRARTKYEKELAATLWRIFSTSANESLHIQLCNLLEEILDGWKSVSRLAVSLDSGSEMDFQKVRFYQPEDAKGDLLDGVFCCREKLHDFSSESVLRGVQDSARPSIASIASSFYTDGDIQLIESCLELLVLIANHETDGISRWFCILCEIIGSPSKSSNVRTLAKRVLKQLCGGKKDLYHSVRDHYVFGFQIKMLLQNTKSVLRNCLMLKEKARQSGPNWKQGTAVRWEDLNVGGLIGVELLLSEDFIPLKSDVASTEILDDLWNVARNRSENWRRFCSLVTPPQSYAGSLNGYADVLLGSFHDTSPIILLVWTACSVVGPNQVKLLKLVDLALANSNDQKRTTSESQETNVDSEAATNERASSSSWLKEEISTPEEILLDSKRKCNIGDLHAFIINFALNGRTGEVRRIACSIATKLLKHTAAADVGTLLGRLLTHPLCDAGRLGKNCVDLLNLLQSQLRFASKLPIDVKETASTILTFFEQQFSSIKHDRANGEWSCIESNSGTTKKKFDLASCANCHWNNTVNTGKESPSKVAAVSARVTPGRASSSAVRGSGPSQTSASAGGGTNQASPQGSAKREWLPEQMSPYTKGRLDNNRETATNDAFASYRQLKHRLALSEIFVNVNDPRGRFVKTITVSFTPRPVSDVQVLKTDDYSRKWQRCATISLSRGVSRASCVLATPVIAANLKIEFTEFYERPGGSKAADGTLLVHCPRCTRVVNNAHGVCGHCGEVAFQCRKCRHINYDQLQSFLCVECGFCSAGSFSFDLVAGVASNAVAITNDDDYDRTARMFTAATRLHEDTREALREKLSLALQIKKNKEQSQENSGGNNQTAMDSLLLSPGLRRAFQFQDPMTTGVGGDPLIDRSLKRGWAVKTIANPASATGAYPLLSSGSGAADRTRSLLRLARQLRTDSGSSDRRRSGDVVIRHLGRGSAHELLMDEDEQELLDLLEGPGGPLGNLSGLPPAGGVLDSSDPLSRLLASFQTTRGSSSTNARAVTASSARELSEGAGSGSRQVLGGTRNRLTGTSSATANRGSSGASTSNAARKQQDMIKEKIDECERLHVVMRESEREAYELSRRMEAWKRLERDEIADRGGLSATSEPALGSALPARAFLPSHCSVCSGPVAVQLLAIWLRLFQSYPSEVTVSQAFIDLLLEENIHLNKSLFDLKRAVLKEIATRAPAATSRLVLNELSKRLKVARDVPSAEILGKIMEEKGSFFLLADDYVNLALEVLQHETIF